jgi:MFS family permease
MNSLLGLLWALGGMVLGFGAFAAGAALFASWTNASNREGAVGYFVIGLGLVGALLGLVAGLVWYARSAPGGEKLRQLGQGALGMAVFAAVVAAAIWAWAQSHETPVLYNGNTQASLLLEFRMAQAAAPAGSARQWLNVEVTTAKTRPVALVLPDEVRQEAAQLIVPAVQEPLIRAGNRLVVARLSLPTGERHEVFMPRMPRRPDPKAGWSDWVSPRTVFDVRTETEGGAALLQMRWRLRLHGE